MSIVEPLPKDAEQAYRKFILENVISRDEYPTEVTVGVYISATFAYAIGIIITHDGFKRQYTVQTHHSSVKDLLHDTEVSKAIDNFVSQFALEYFYHCMDERVRTTVTKYYYDSETRQSYESDVHKYFAKCYGTT